MLISRDAQRNSLLLTEMVKGVASISKDLMSSTLSTGTAELQLLKSINLPFCHIV